MIPNQMRNNGRWLVSAIVFSALIGCAGPAIRAQAPESAVFADSVSEGFTLPSLPAPAPISRQEYADRRAAFARTLDDGVFVAFGSSEPELDYLPYFQNASFRYLTGITEPGAGLIIVRDNGAIRETLFVQRRDPALEIWEGARLGIDAAAARTGIETRPSDELLSTLGTLVAGHTTLYVLTPPSPTGGMVIASPEQQIVRAIATAHPQTRVVSVADRLERIRARKSPAELDMIRRAVLISTLAHREAMRSVMPGMNEFEIQALVEYVFRRSGAEGPAYSSIVGSGPNSTTLHYRSADRYMNAGELLVMDVGASYRGYAADLTRTMPVSGRFTPDQRAIYDLVLEAQSTAEDEIRIGGSWNELDAAVIRVLARGLTELGLIDAPDATYDCGTTQALRQCPQFRLFYMHGLGHGVGLEVHDPEISTFERFQPGGAFTLEPGLYVRADVLDYLPDTPANRAMIERLRPAVTRYRDIGVRIEDVYLITDEGVERPSTALPRDADAVEALMRETGPGERDRQPEIVEWYRATTAR